MLKISNEEYLNIKAKALSGEVFSRANVPVKDIILHKQNSVSIKGTRMDMSPRAFQSLAKSLNLSGAFIKTVSAIDSGDQGLLGAIISKLSTMKVNELTVVFNKTLGLVVNIYPAGSKLISDAAYFSSLERIIETTPGSFLRNFMQGDNGDLNAVVANPKLEFQLGNMKNEVFSAGMTLDLNSSSMSTSFFTERLWCTNGCSIKDKMMSKSVRSQDGLPGFMSAILDADYHLNSVSEFKTRIIRCASTIASLREVLACERRVRSITGKHSDILMMNMDLIHVKTAFPDKYLENADAHKFLATNMSLWDVVNEVTAISAHIEQNNLRMPASTNFNLQRLGGDIMFNIPDLAPSSIKQVFGTSGELIKK